MKRSFITLKPIYLSYVVLLVSLCTFAKAVPVHARGEIQKEVPLWEQGKTPTWNDPAAWRHGRKGDPSMDTDYLRKVAELGDLRAGVIVQARKFAAEGKYAQAFAEFKHAALLGKTPYDEWGDALEASGNRTEALRAYQQLIYCDRFKFAPDGKKSPDTSRDWKDAQGRSLREMVVKHPMGGRPLSAVWVGPSVYMRYALLLLKSGQYDEAVQIRNWTVEDMASYDRIFKTHGWLETEFTASAIRRDPSLFVAQAWTIIGLFDNTRRTEDFPGLIAIIRFKKAIAARPDFAPAQMELAKNYRFIGEHYDKTYLSLASEAYEAAKFYGKGDVRTKAVASIKEINSGEKSKTVMLY